MRVGRQSINIPEWQKILRGQDWKFWALRSAAVAVGVLLLVQIFYPGDRMLPFVSVDGHGVGGKTKTDAAKMLNAAYDQSRFAIYINQAAKPLLTPTLKEAQLKVDNTPRIEATKYPWYLRIVPTSLFWAGRASSSAPKPQKLPGHDTYVDQKLMPQCRKDPVDASLKASNDKLQLVASISGGQCSREAVLKSMATLVPNLKKSSNVHVPVTVIPPKVTDQAARAKQKHVEAAVGDGVKLQVGSEVITIAPKDFYAWLDFTSQDTTLQANVNLERSKNFLDKVVSPKVAVKPGVSQITTRDFTEISRVNGAPGQALDVPATIQALSDVANVAAPTAHAVIKQLAPVEQYTRTYSDSDAGLSALFANYAKDHPGTYGMSLIELDGKKRRADYQGDKQFVTASTYKLFVAYSVLKRIDSGQWSWASEGDCFNKMISNSDNACAENFLGRVGLSAETSEMKSLGLNKSTFMKTGGPFTTAKDLTLLLGMIATGQNFSSTSQQRLIAAMKANVYRQGIPAGVKGIVADKVGFMNGLLHDAAIVYSPNGTYVLAIMTDGASWGAIADVAKQIDALRSS